MSIDYIDPLERSWARAKRMLFRPFNLDFWLALGFAAFLANLGEGGGGFQWSRPLQGQTSGDVAQDIHDFLHEPYTLWILGIVLVVILMLGIVLGWVGARGKFIFLDDVLHERAAIVEPWKRFRRIGNSLFLFQLLVGSGFLAVFLVLFGGLVRTVLLSIWRDGTFPDFEPWSFVIPALIAVPLWLVALILFTLSKHFVVPIMWKHDLGAIAAWKRFGPLLTDRPGAFVVYLLFLLALGIALLAAFFVAGVCTCCVGFLLMAIPYIGSVVLLPIFVPWRLLGPEFLAQFGADWDVRPVAAVADGSPDPPRGDSGA